MERLLVKTSKRKILQTYFPNAQGLVPGWGNKRSAARAKLIALATFRKPVFLEDGFLRSIARNDKPISIVFDDIGIYYDARRPSGLEALIASSLTKQQYVRAQRIADLWREGGVSKYNSMPDPQDPIKEPYVLVVDQVRGDMSISSGLASPKDFERMLEDACNDHPDKIIVVKTHPDAAKERKKSHFDRKKLTQNPKIVLLDEPVHPVDLIRNAKAVYTVTSQMGFEALIHGTPVFTYGVPFYAGWSLTTDRADVFDPRIANAFERRQRVNIESLVHSALVDYPGYINPDDNAQITPESAILMVSRHREKMRLRKGVIHAVGFSLWKRPTLRAALSPAEIKFHTNMKTVPDGSTVALWGAHGTQHLYDNCKILRIEDGFIRSKGLGADLNTPISWVIDDMGIYFDSTSPSRLEHILQKTDIHKEVIKQGMALKTRIIEGGFTKYNLRGSPWSRPAKEKRVILVPGQVETDASIKFGSPQIKTNLELVKAVRIANPGSYLVYKPHPDVVNGYRTKGGTEDLISQFCNDVVPQGDILSLLEQVDEVHTITSLTGFEALIRGLPVTCYGQPFYSGWGLTNDIHPCERRTRKRTVEELISAALIEYPNYMSLQDGRSITPMAAIHEIENHRPGILSRLPFRRSLVKYAARRSEIKREARA